MSAVYVWAAVVTAPTLAALTLALFGLVLHLDRLVEQLRDDADQEALRSQDLEIRNALLERQLDAAVDFVAADLQCLPIASPDQEL